MSTLKLRDYQRDAIDAVRAAHADGMRRPAVVLPTGAGKTVVFSAMLREHAAAGTGRSMVIVHRDELADQAIAKIRSAAPDLSVGKVKAQDNDVDADVVVASVQTISRPRRLAELGASQVRSRSLTRPPSPFSLIVTDECHHAAAPSYQTVYDMFPSARHVGFTATLERGDRVGLGQVWDDVVFSRSPLWMMKHGYLVQPRAYREDITGFDLTSVKRSQGDFQAGDLGRALEESDLAETLPGVWKEHAAGRPTVVFTPTVATAHGVAESFRAAGVTADVISGETPREERLGIFERFRTGATVVLVNCMVLTEGFDAPWASCAIIARPTQSRPLYVQMVGRVLRPWKDKTDAIVINVAGAGGRIATLVDLSPDDISEVKEGEGLLEAEEREQQDERQDEPAAAPRPRRGPLKLKEVTSLFEASHHAWQTTAGGVMFLGAGEWTYFLWANREQPGTWDVCRKPKHGAWERTGHMALDVEMAMSWAEAEAQDHGSFSVSKRAAWRSGKPSDAQLNYASALGIDATGLNKSDLSDAISYVLESRSLDPYVGRV